MNSLNTIIADVIHYVHILLVLYVLTGWILTPVRKIHYYILFVLLILLDWNDLDGQCVLTKLEHYFREKTKMHDDKMSQEPEFFRPLMIKMFNIKLTSEQSMRINYFTFISGILLAFLRLLHHRRRCC